MNIIHFTLKPQSGFATPLRGDTLIGNMIWQYLYKEGSAKFESFLNELDNDLKNVPACSDLFPNRYLPIPTLPPYEPTKEEKDKYDRKKMKKVKFLKLDDWKNLQQNVSSKAIFEEKAKWIEEKVYFDFEESELHNTINRLTGTTGEGGGLFTRNVKGYGKPYNYNTEEEGVPIELHGYLYPGIWGDSANELLEQVGKMGYGADATTGLGRFEVIDFTELSEYDPLFNLESANAWMALSRHLPDSKDITNVKIGFYTLETHYGRLGGTLATSGTPFKKPLLLFGASSVWDGKPPQDYCPGGVINDMGYQTPKKIRHLGRTLALPLRVTDEEILAEWNNKEGN